MSAGRTTGLTASVSSLSTPQKPLIGTSVRYGSLRTSKAYAKLTTTAKLRVQAAAFRQRLFLADSVEKLDFKPRSSNAVVPRRRA